MTSDGPPNRFDELRTRAERILDAESPEARTEVQRSVSELVEELQTHQIELELQNEELQSARQALETSQVRYRTLFDFAPVTYLILDADGLVIDINVTGVDLLHVTRRRIIDKPLWLYVRPEHRDRLARHIKTVIDQGSEQACELGLRRKDDSQLWGRLHSVPHKSNSEDVQVRTALIDVTARKELEQDLIVAREEAVKATQAQRAFLSNMSHEIRTPLTSVIGFAEALGEMAASGEQREFAEAIAGSGQRLLDTLNSVLDYTRIQNQDHTIQLTRLDVAEQVSECVRALQPQAATKGLELVVDSGAREEYALLHEDYFGRVLNNMVSNALKYTEEGTITVSVVQHDDEVEIRVEDTGIGIDESLLNRIFEPFLQAEFGPKRQHEGVGLGLAITKRLVHRMNGRMDVQSAVGEGSRFSTFFPRLTTEPPTPASDRSASGAGAVVQPYPLLSEATILVVEDNADTRQLVRLFLKAASQVESAASGQEALDHLAEGSFDGILLDINLGEEQTGLELIKIIREMEGYQSVPIVAFTAYALPGDAERFLKAGFDSYVRKPFTKRQLLRTLNSVLASGVPRSSSPPFRSPR
jgi:PAS domain S-box-containing protein